MATKFSRMPPEAASQSEGPSWISREYRLASVTSEGVGICWQQKAWLVKTELCRHADLPCTLSFTEVLSWHSLPGQRRGSQVLLKLSLDLGPGSITGSAKQIRCCSM